MMETDGSRKRKRVRTTVDRRKSKREINIGLSAVSTTSLQFEEVSDHQNIIESPEVQITAPDSPVCAGNVVAKDCSIIEPSEGTTCIESLGEIGRHLDSVEEVMPELTEYVGDQEGRKENDRGIADIEYVAAAETLDLSGRAPETPNVAKIPYGDVFPEPNDCKWNRLLFDGSKMTIGQFLALFTAVVDRAELTIEARGDLLKLFHATLPDPGDFPRSYATLLSKLSRRKILEDSSERLLCEKCGNCLPMENDKQSLICAHQWGERHCGMVNKRDSPTIRKFSYLSMEDYIKTQLEVGALKTSKQILCPEVDDRSITCFRQSAVYRHLAASEESEFLVMIANSDGASISRSSNAGIWIGQAGILQPGKATKWRVHTLEYKARSEKKELPDPDWTINGLHEMFVMEMVKFGTEGIAVRSSQGTRIVKIFLFAFMADAPERLKVRMMRNYHSQFGCTHCPFKGHRALIDADLDNRSKQTYPFFPEISQNYFALRDNEKSKRIAIQADQFTADVYLEKWDRNSDKNLKTLGLINKVRPITISRQEINDTYDSFCGVTGISFLSRMPEFNEVLQVGVDSMHMIFEGVGKEMVLLLKKTSNRSSPWNLTPAQFKEIAAECARAQFTSTFQRCSRGLGELLQWKGNEVYGWTLILAIPVLHGFFMSRVELLRKKMSAEKDSGKRSAIQAEILLEIDKFRFFALFSAVTQYFFSEHMTIAGLEEIRVLLVQYGLRYQEIAGGMDMRYNLHQFVVHFVQYTCLLGPPWITSMFGCESNIKEVKRHIKSATDPRVEAANKQQFAACRKKLERIYLPESSDDFVHKLARTFCHRLKTYSLRVSQQCGTVYFGGAPKTIEGFYALEEAESDVLHTLLNQNFPGMTDLSVEIYSSCTTEANLKLKIIKPKKLKRCDSIFLSSEDEIYFCAAFLAVWENPKRSGPCHTFVYGNCTELQPWNYFGFDGDDLLKNKILQGFYKKVKETGHRRLLKINEVKKKVVLVPAREVTVPHEDNCFLVIPEFPFVPS